MITVLSDLLKGTIDYRGKTPKKFDSGIPVISAANIKNGKIKVDGKFVSEEYYNKWTTRGYIEPGDILITTEAPVAEIAKVPGDQTYLISRRVIALQVDLKKADSSYIYYLLRTEGILRYFESLSHGATVPRIYKEDILSLEINLPELPTQNKIASILTAYDDLIENNNQRIKLLEEMAEEIYKEWFVRFRFPGYQNTNFVDKEGKQVPHGTKGAIPEGWEKLKLRECLAHYIGGGWGEEFPNGKNTIPAHVIRGTDFPDYNVGKLNFDVLRYHTKSNLSSRICEPKDIIFEVSGGTESQSLGRTCFLSKIAIERFDEPVICASFCKLLRVDSSIVSPLYINELLNRMHGTGELKVYQVQSTGISNYQFEDFIEATKINIPPDDVQEKFDNIIAPMYDEIQILGAKNQILQETRDLLLPRLISGKLSVDNIPIQENELQIAAEAESPTYTV